MATTTTAASPPSASVGDEWFDTASGNRRCECTAVIPWTAATGFTDWTATNASSAVTASWPDGSQALTVTASGAGNWLAASPAQAVSPGDVVSATAQLYSPAVTLNQVSLGIAWYDGSSTQIGSPTLGAVAALAAGTPGTYTVTGTAPANAASFTLQPGDAEASTAGTQMAVGSAVATHWVVYQAGTNAIANAAITPGQVAGNAIQAGAVATGAIDGLAINAVTINGSTITAADVLISGSQGGLFVYSSGGTVTQTLTGSGNWLCPAGVTSVMAECWGGGGGGSGSGTSGSAGGGGEYASEPSLAVTPGHSYAYAVGGAGTGGAAGANGGSGSSSTFAGDSVTVTAHGGSGFPGAGGTGSTNTGHFNGGSATTAFDGGGGGSGGTASAGNPGGVPTGAAAVTGGGPGGDGRASGNALAPSTGPGGGGGGSSFGAGGNGFHGKVRLTYTSTSPALIGSIAGAAGTSDPVASVAYPEGVASDHVTLTTVTAVPATPSLGCVLYYKSGALWALGPSGTPVSIATT